MNTTHVYSSGEPLTIGDIVRRSKTSKATYVVDKWSTYEGQVVVWLAPHSGYTSASAFGDTEISRLVKVTEP